MSQKLAKQQWECIKKNQYPPQGPQRCIGRTKIATADRDWEIESLTIRQRTMLGDISL